MKQEDLESITENCLKALKQDSDLVWNNRPETCKSIINWTINYLTDRYKLYLN